MIPIKWKVFYNLVSNAFKFTTEQGEISVSIKIIETALVEIKVKDTGTGIPADSLSHIFDRFYQVDGSNTREYEGTGIGLALTKELVELHKGKITISSKEGEGSEFTIDFPLGDLNVETEKLYKLSINSSKQKNILNDAGVSETELILTSDIQLPTPG